MFIACVKLYECHKIFFFHAETKSLLLFIICFFHIFVTAYLYGETKRTTCNSLMLEFVNAGRTMFVSCVRGGGNVLSCFLVFILLHILLFTCLFLNLFIYLCIYIFMCLAIYSFSICAFITCSTVCQEWKVV